MNEKQLEGKIGEDKAEIYLKEQGYKILCRNFRCMQGEIDIIAREENTIVFVEVKTRTSTKYGEAREAVDKRKQKHIYQSARYYLYQNKKESSNVRIDVIEVYINNR